MKKDLCIVCESPKLGATILCKRCAASYDRMIDKDATTANIIRWAANRARLAERKSRDSQPTL